MKAPNFTIKSIWITIKLMFTIYFILALSYKVCGYTRHDTLYEEARPEDIQNRGKSGQKGVHIGTFLNSINEDKRPLVSEYPPVAPLHTVCHVEYSHKPYKIMQG